MFRSKEFQILFGLVLIAMVIAASIGFGDFNLKELASILLEGWF